MTRTYNILNKVFKTNRDKCQQSEKEECYLLTCLVQYYCIVLHIQIQKLIEILNVSSPTPHSSL